MTDTEKTCSTDSLFAEVIKGFKDLGLKLDFPLIEKAFKFACDSHGTQTRTSGEPYIHHPLEVARILGDLGLDTASIVTGILHDTVEDTKVSLKDLEKEFSPQVALLVDGVTKISKITFQTSEEKQAENFRKMVLAMAKDLRVILVKLADRLHNMRTLQHLNPNKQRRIAQETLDIYSPLANRLGLYSLKRELEDLSLRYTKPEFYYRLVAQVAKKRKERDAYTKRVMELINEALKKHAYEADVSGRPKHFFSIHQKMEKQNLTYDQIYDITGFRIIVGTVEQCYGTLGLMHSLWTPVPGRFKDYVAIPKANFYQSLHTTVIGPEGEHIEIQIRTHEMHETAERGIAAHWAYKEGNSPSANEKQRFDWLNRLLEWNKDLDDPNEYLETVKLDLFAEEVYVFTPTGEVRELPQGATPLDFAYSIHTDVGNRCVGARINNRMVPLKSKLTSGDTVEIITSANQRPHKDWLKNVVTSRAKSKIRAYIKAEEHERSLSMGQTILEKQLKKSGHRLNKLMSDGTLKKIAKDFTYHSAEDLLSAIGYGKVTVGKVLNRLNPNEEQKKEPKEKKGALQEMFDKAAESNPAKHAIKVKGVEDLLVRFAKCCNPVPGDQVVGFITRGRGISVHSAKCTKVFESDPHRLIEIEWDLSKRNKRTVKIRVVCEDRPGLLAEMSRIIRDLEANISRAQIGTTKDQTAICHFTVMVADSQQLRDILSNLGGLEGIISAERIQRRDRS